jgi:hypothetical protein
MTRRSTFTKRLGFAVLVLCATALVGSIAYTLLSAIVVSLGLPSWAAFAFVAVVSIAASAYYRALLFVTLACVAAVALLLWAEPEAEQYECAPEPASVEVEL